MTYPKFAVGEEVLIYSGSMRADGVEATVTSRVFARGATHVVTNDIIDNGYFYATSADNDFPYPDSLWMEASLRKRPSDFTFNELMEELKTPVPA